MEIRAGSPSAGKRFRVLLVDDDAGLRSLCAETLSPYAIDVIEAENGQVGLELALAEPPDLVLLDLSMPVLDGFGLARALSEDERTRSVPFVILTGEPGDEARALAQAAGALAFVSKPFDPSGFTALVDGVLSRAGEPFDELRAFAAGLLEKPAELV